MNRPTKRPPEPTPAGKRWTMADTKLLTLRNADISRATAVTAKNIKLGEIPSANLRPVKDCLNCSLCKLDCYGIQRSWNLRPGVRVALTRNAALLRVDRYEYFARARYWLAKKQPHFFRIHSTGDLISRPHWDGWRYVAEDFPDTRFLSFTKSFQLIEFSDSIPDNLSLVPSMWPGMPIPEHLRHLPFAWMQDGTEDRVPENAIECPGGCENCGMCWELKKLGRDVVFHKH